MRARLSIFASTVLLAAACAYAPAADDGASPGAAPIDDAGGIPSDGGRPPPSLDGDAEVDAARDAGPTSDAARPDAAPTDAGSDGSPWGPAPDITAVLTADNAYGFGWGDVNGVTTYTPVAPATLASEIFSCPLGVGPESFAVPGKDAPAHAYFYIVAWADHATTQGVIGQLKAASGSVVLTGDSRWQACATGVEYIAPAPGPVQATVAQQIAACNAGTGDKSTTSGGWVDVTGAVTPGAVGTLAVGEDNSDNTGAFQIACQSDNGKEGVPAAARWMWYTPNGGDAFHYVGPGDTTRTFLIFRLPSNAF